MADNLEKTRVDAETPVLPVQIHAQYVKDFSFENPNSPTSLRPSQARAEMDVNIVLDAVKIDDESNTDLYEAGITLTVKSMREGRPLFIAEIVYAALVTVKDIPGPQVRQILYIDIPHLLFPFARQMLAGAVSAGGFPPLLLNPVDFRAMYASSARAEK